MIEVVASKRNCLKNYVSLKRAAVSVCLLVVVVLGKWREEEKSPQFMAFLIESD